MWPGGSSIHSKNQESLSSNLNTRFLSDVGKSLSYPLGLKAVKKM